MSVCLSCLSTAWLSPLKEHRFPYVETELKKHQQQQISLQNQPNEMGTSSSAFLGPSQQPSHSNATDVSIDLDQAKNITTNKINKQQAIQCLFDFVGLCVCACMCVLAPRFFPCSQLKEETQTSIFLFIYLLRFFFLFWDRCNHPSNHSSAVVVGWDSLFCCCCIFSCLCNMLVNWIYSQP